MIANDTIAAISTPPGTGAIAIVRISGPESLKILSEIFSCSSSVRENSVDWSTRSHEAVHGYIFDRKKSEDSELIDEVVVITYKGPNTYTGEDLVEINCHGNPLIASEILSLLIRLGARLASAGEFTKRAFLSGRMDLTQAEAVLDLIQAKTSRQSRLAISTLDGHLGKQIKSVRMTLMEVLAQLIAGIDFPEEVEEMPRYNLGPIVEQARKTLLTLADTARSGRFLREGLKLAIIGRPNAGKSSLLNQLLKFERAIVTDIPGTTRDSIEELIDLNGIPVILVDTAGIRVTEDMVEKMGIERTSQAISESDLCIFLLDPIQGFDQTEAKILEILADRPHLLVINKIDIAPEPEAYLSSSFTFYDRSVKKLFLSAKTGKGIEELCLEVESFATGNGSLSNYSLSEAGASLNQRQADLCLKAADSLDLLMDSLEADMLDDCLATDLKEAVHCLSVACGDEVTEEVISEVFSRFCIGK